MAGGVGFNGMTVGPLWTPSSSEGVEDLRTRRAPLDREW